jgi:hypothetical protein
MVLPPPWDAYMRLQSTLDDTTEINNRSWGLEAALDAILAGATPDGTSTPASDVATTIATAGRRERHRARLRRTYSPTLWPIVDQPAVIEARAEIEQVRRFLHPSDWQLISSVAMGMDYRAIGNDIGATPSSLRVRVMRIRDGLRWAA